MKLLGAPAADENSIYVDAFDDTLANAMVTLDDRTRGIEVSSSTTATARCLHIVTATATLTDPAPSQADWYWVLVRNGTATVGSLAYPTAGTLIYRVFHSGAWASYPMLSSGTTNTLGNADATLASTNRRVILGATLTAVRTITLPAASAVPAGVPIAIMVPSGAISTSYALVFAAAGSDTIHGAASAGMMTHGLVFLASDGVSAWSMTRLPAVSLEVATQEDVTTATLTDSTALKRYVPPGKYRVRAEFSIWTANTAEGTKGNVAFTGTATTRSARYQMDANSTSATTFFTSRPVSVNAMYLSGNDPFAFAGFSTGSGYILREFILTVTVGGFISVQFAHWSGTTSTCSLGVGSQLQIEPIR